MSRRLPGVLMALMMTATPALANTWVATAVGLGTGGTVRVNVSLSSDFERINCGPAPCRTTWFVDLYVAPPVSGTTHYMLSKESAQAGIELLLSPGVEYSFSGSYMWVDFRPDHLGACVEISCQGNVPTETTLFTPTMPLAIRNSTWGAIKALYR